MLKLYDLNTKDFHKQLNQNEKMIKQCQKLNEEFLKELQPLEQDGFYCLLGDEVWNDAPGDIRSIYGLELTYHICVLLLKYYNAGHLECYPSLMKTLTFCVAKKFASHGYECDEVRVEYLTALLEERVLDLPLPLEVRHEFIQLVERYRLACSKDQTIFGFGSNLQTKLTRLLAAFDEHVVFVYGTLLQGNTNHHYLKDAYFLSDTTIEGYTLLELGAYPGMVPCSEACVYGELYVINQMEKAALDQLEGTQYTCCRARAMGSEKIYYPQFYELCDAQDYPKSMISGKWRPEK